MEKVIEILMERDNMSRKEAVEKVEWVREELLDMVYNGATLDEVEGMFFDHLGLEPDYLMEFLV